MSHKHSMSGVAERLSEADSVLEVAAGLDPFLSFSEIETDAENWLELLAYSWGVDGLSAVPDESELTEMGGYEADDH